MVASNSAGLDHTLFAGARSLTLENGPQGIHPGVLTAFTKSYMLVFVS